MTDGWTNLGQRSYSLEQQLEFARFSGDYNPIHINPVQARKTLMGECIVHGVACVLWSLDLFCTRFKTTPTSLRIEFKKPIRLDSEVACFWNEDKGSLRIMSDQDEVLFTIKLTDLLPSESIDHGALLDEFPLQEIPLEPNLQTVSEGEVFAPRFGGDHSIGEQLFPELCSRIGVSVVYEVALLSSVVGMQLPGLHSLFSGARVSFSGNAHDVEPGIEVIKKDDRFGLIELAYHGRNIDADLAAFVRPYYKPKTCQDLVELLPPHVTLRGKKVLIVGGSRGIGAAVARVAGLSGADVTLTFVHGKEDAENVCSDIQDHTGQSAHAIQLDVKDATSFDVAYDVLCYFATPKIFGKTSNSFELDRFERLYTVYCKAFGKIAREFLMAGGRSIYYPSSVAVDQDVRGLEEYKVAKEIGEKVCGSLGQEFGAKVIIDRLDRVETDQTLTVSNVPSSDAASIAVSIVEKLADDVD